MEKKKIIFHINSMGKGGAERVVSILTEYFAKDGYEILVVTLWRAEEEYALADPVRRINLGDMWQDKHMGRLQRAVRRFLDLRKLLLKEKPDLVISFCNKANFRCAYAMMGMRIPLITSVRNDPRVDYLPYKRSVKRMEKKAAGCVFQTADAKSCFSEAFQKTSKVIWNPVDEKYLRQNRKVQEEHDAENRIKEEGRAQTEERISAGVSTQQANSLRIEEASQTAQGEIGTIQGKRKLNQDIITVGRLSEQKNQLLLIKAFDRIREQFPNAQVKIYGEESEAGRAEMLKEYIKTGKLEEQVHLMGPSSYLEKEIADAALFVLPSDYEGMPNALIEAMVLGLPVISTDCPCGGPAELIENGVSGLLVAVGDEEGLAEAMRRVLQDRSFAERLGRNAGRLAEKVSPEKIYEEWKDYVTGIMT